MAKRFLNNININDQYTFPSTDGSAGQAIITDGAGNLTFGSAIASSADSTESIHISVKNTSGAQILKGTPVYVTGETGNSGKIEVAPADASDSAKMPALGLLESTLNNNAEGFCVQGGLLEGLATATIDGTATTANDTVYVKSGGGLTMTKPTGTGLIQNIAKVARVNASNGSLVVSSILRTNDVPNLTTGKIWVGDGNTTESTVVHLDEVNGRMGIGTTSPFRQLELRGQGVIRLNAISSGDPGLDFNTSDVDDMQIRYRSTTDALAIYSYGTSSDVLTIKKSDGNVGIGTTSPSEKLQIYEGGNTAYKSYTNTNVGAILTSYQSTFSPFTKTTDLVAGSDGTVPSEIRFLTRESGVSTVDERMRIASNGNVGIGTTSPNANLHVYSSGNGEIEVERAGGALINLQAQTSLGSIGTDSNHPLYLKTNAGTRVAITSGGNVGIGTTSPAQKLDVVGKMKISDDIILAQTNGRIDYDNGVSSGALRFFSTSGNSERMRITSAGNVGIGTTSPGYKLDIAAVINNQKLFRLSHPSAPTEAGFMIGFNSDGITNDVIVSQSVEYSSVDYDVININRSNRNVGIGTTSPGEKLEVVGDDVSGPSITWKQTNRRSGYLYSDSSGVGIYDTALNNAGIYLANNSRMDFRVNGSERMRIDSNGNVGIGTTSPSIVGGTAKMTINVGASPSPVSIVNGTTDGMYIRRYDTNGQYQIQTTVGAGNSGNLSLQTYGGNVGIGTTTPLDLLHVKSTTNDARMILDGATGFDAELKFFENGTAKYTVGYDAASTNFVIGTANVDTNQRLVISSAGNVGIGTTSPGAKLHVLDNSSANVLAKIRIQGDAVSGYGDIGMQSGYIRLFSNGSMCSAWTGSVQYNYINGGAATTLNSTGFGIGTTSPSALLDIASGVGSTEFTGHQILMTRNGNNEIYAQGASSVLALGTNGSEDMRIDSSGNVGIGTTAPGTKLQVSDTIAGYVSTIENLGIGADKSGLWIKTDSTWTNAIILKLTGGTSDVSIMEVNTATVRIGGGAITQNDQALHLPDNKRIGLGDSGDLQIYHDGSNSYITDSGTGNLRIRSTSLRLENTDSSNMVVANGGGSVAIYYNGSAKFSTTNTGVSVTGQTVSSLALISNAVDTGNPQANTDQLRLSGYGVMGNRGALYFTNALAAGNLQFGVGGAHAANTELTIAQGASTFAGTVTAPTFLGDLNGTINTATTAVTKANSTNDTTVATTAFVQNLIGTIPAGLVFQGTWNAATNTPTLTSGSGTTGNFYIVSVDGTTNLDDITDWKVGDWAVFVEQGASDQWEKVDNSSVLDGSGTGQTLPLWSGSGTSNTLTDSLVSQPDTTTVQLNNADLKIVNDLQTGGNGKARIKFSEDVTTNSMDIYYDGDGQIGDANYTSIFSHKAGVGDVLVTTYGGNVGIGTTDPSFKLSVDGTVGIIGSRSTYIDASEDSTATSHIFTTNDDVGDFSQLAGNLVIQARVHPTVYRDIIFAGGLNTAGPLMTIQGEGNVGIGTTSPQSKLQVAGGIQMADDTDTASAAKVGTMRYRTAANEPVPVTGIDFITNGDFATDSDWSKGAGWTISGGLANHAGAGGTLIQSLILIIGKTYQISYKASGISGTLAFTGFSESLGQRTLLSGSNTIILTASSTSFGVFSDANATIDNVSVIEVTEEDASYADMCMQTGASTYEWVNIVRNTY